MEAQRIQETAWSPRQCPAQVHFQDLLWKGWSEQGENLPAGWRICAVRKAEESALEPGDSIQDADEDWSSLEGWLWTYTAKKAATSGKSAAGILPLLVSSCHSGNNPKVGLPHPGPCWLSTAGHFHSNWPFISLLHPLNLKSGVNRLYTWHERNIPHFVKQLRDPVMLVIVSEIFPFLWKTSPKIFFVKDY